MRSALRKLLSRLTLQKVDAELPPLAGIDREQAIDEMMSPLADEEVRARLLKMPIMVREVYLLQVIDNLSTDQVADRLAVSRSKVIRYMGQAIALLVFDNHASS